MNRNDQEASALAIDQLHDIVDRIIQGWNQGDLPKVREAFVDMYRCLSTIENVAKDQLWRNLR